MKHFVNSLLGFWCVVFSFFSSSDFVSPIVLARTFPLEPEFCCLQLMAFSRGRLNMIKIVASANFFKKQQESRLLKVNSAIFKGNG